MSAHQNPLPLKNGIAASWVSIQSKNGLLLDFLCQRFPNVERAQWIERIRTQEVVNQAGQRLHERSLCSDAQVVFYYREVEHETHIPFSEQILWQDEHLTVVDKPHFLPVTPAGLFLQQTLLTRLRQTLDNPHISPIHRLDKDTAGVMLFANQPKSRGAYQQLFQHHAIHKIYHAVAATRTDLTFPLTYESCLIESDTQFFKMRESTGAPNSRTTIKLLNHRADGLSLYQLEPQTGKKHQLRAHMNALGMPIVNDFFYPSAQSMHAIDYDKPLQLLAKSIAFIDPISHQARFFSSPRQL